jgi:thiamine-phosphate pyrophosphorylase
MPPDYLLIAITAPDLVAGRVLDSCRAAAAGGATAIQMRLKHASASELCRATERAMAVLDVPVYVNDRLDVALACGAAGVHLGAEDLPPGRVRAILPAELRVGLSVGDPVEAAEATAVRARYWSLGPFYRTRTKADAGPALEVEGFSRLLRHVPEGLPAIAIGGIDERNVSAVIGAGARGVAVISAIFGAADIEAATRGIRDALDACMR